jgi:glycosyltransferase involved in cell wall biosynthesis
MNILQVSHSFIPCYDSGGVVRSVYTLSKELASRGHNVTVYTTDGCTKRLDVEKNKRVDLDGVNVYYFSNISNTLRMRFKIATPVHLLRVTGKTIKNYKVIHKHEPRTTIAWIVSYYARKHKIPYVVHARGSLTLTTGRTNFKKVFDLLFGKKTITEASKLVALTRDESKQYIEMGADPEKIEVIPNAIDLSLYESIPSQGELREKYGISSQDKICFCGD